MFHHNAVADPDAPTITNHHEALLVLVGCLRAVDAAGGKNFHLAPLVGPGRRFLEWTDAFGFGFADVSSAFAIFEPKPLFPVEQLLFRKRSNLSVFIAFFDSNYQSEKSSC